LRDTPATRARNTRLYYTLMSTEEAARGSSPTARHEQIAAQPAEQATGGVGAHYDTRLPQLPWSRRAQIPFIAAAVYSVIRLLGPTLRYEVLGWQNPERVHASGKRCIWAFWHRVIIPIVWWHRNHGVVVMNTTAFDGQWT